MNSLTLTAHSNVCNWGRHHFTYGSDIDPRYAALWVENPFSHTSARTTYRLGEANFHTGPEEEGIFSHHIVLLSISVYVSCVAIPGMHVLKGYIRYCESFVLQSQYVGCLVAGVIS